MGSLTLNRLNVTLTAAAITGINTSIAAILAQLPAGTLTDEERATFKAIDVDNKIFVDDTIAQLGISGAGIMPAFINAASIENDRVLFEQVDTIESALVNLTRRVSDLKRIVGSESLDACNMVYGIYKSASAAAIPGAKESYEKLKERYEKSNASGSRPAAVNP